MFEEEEEGDNHEAPLNKSLFLLFNPPVRGKRNFQQSWSTPRWLL